MNVSGTNLGTRGAELLLSALSDCLASLHIIELDISRNEIEFGHEHFGSLINLISNRQCTIEILNISNNTVGDEMLGTLAPHMVNRVTLQHLRMENCRINFKGFTAFLQYIKTNVSIVELRLDFNTLLMPELGDGIGQVGDKEFKEMEAFVLEFFQVNNSLRHMSLSRCSISD